MSHLFGFDAEWNTLLPPPHLLYHRSVFSKQHQHYFNIQINNIIFNNTINTEQKNNGKVGVGALNFGIMFSPDYFRCEISG